jgi:choline transport protein
MAGLAHLRLAPAIATAVVILLPRAIPKGEIFFFLCNLIGFFVFFITVLGTSKHKQPASAIFSDFQNVTGWSDGTAFMLGVGTCMYAYLATDGARHIAEVS